MSPKRLFAAPEIDLLGAPAGTFRYASLSFARNNLPADVLAVLETMALGLVEPRVTYRYVALLQGKALGNPDWHCDGQQKLEEVHRLLCLGTEDTEGYGGTILTRGWVWEYDGAYLHRPLPTDEPSTMRFLLRVSQTKMLPRNYWS